MLCVAELLEALKRPPEDLLKAASGEEQSEDADSDEVSDQPDSATPTAPHNSSKQPADSIGRKGAAPAVDSGGWPLLKQLRHQLQQHLRRQQHLQLAAVAPQLSKLQNTAIPLPADDMTADMLPPLPLKTALERFVTHDGADHTSSSTAVHVQGGQAAGSAACAGASVLLSATGATAAAAAGGEDLAAGGSGSSWLCIAAFDKQVAVLPTKTRPKRLLMLASDGSVHAFLLKGRDDLRVDERLMQFMQASNAVLAAEGAASAAMAAAATAATAAEQAPASAAAAVVAGWGPGACKAPLRVRPYSITPFGRRAGLVQWVRHTTSLYGLFRNWQQCAAERYQAVAAAKRDAAAHAATAGAASAAGGGGQSDRQAAPQLGASAAGVGKSGVAAAGAADAAATATAAVPLPLIVAASRPTDAFYARLLPALQAAGLPVGSSRSTWPASEFCRSVANQPVLHYSVYSSEQYSTGFDDRTSPSLP